jgi:hypothetical protein
MSYRLLLLVVERDIGEERGVNDCCHSLTSLDRGFGGRGKGIEERSRGILNAIEEAVVCD